MFATVGQCYKSFYHGNLLPLYGNYSGNIFLQHRVAVNYHCEKCYNIGPWSQSNKTFLE